MKPFRKYLTESLSISRIQAIYSKYNKIAFNNKLPNIPIKLSNLKNIAGGVDTMAFVQHKYNRRTREAFDIVMTFRNLGFAEDVLERLVVHEMIHVEVIVDGVEDNASHGREFMKRLEQAQRKVGFAIPVNSSASEVADALENSSHIPAKEMGIIYYLHTQKFFFCFFPISQIDKYVQESDRIFERMERGERDLKEVGIGTIVTKEYKQFPVKVKFPFVDGRWNGLTSYRGSLDIYHRIKVLKKK